MIKFEYTVHPVTVNNSEGSLNMMGAGGWELVSIYYVNGALHGFFKRPLAK